MKQTNNNYNQLVDYQVQSMNRFESISDTMKEEDLPDWTNNERPPFVPKTVTTTERKSFDELYEEYSSKSIPEQITNLKQLGRQLVSQIDGIIDQLDVILEEDNYPDNGILEDGQLPKESYNKGHVLED